MYMCIEIDCMGVDDCITFFCAIKYNFIDQCPTTIPTLTTGTTSMIQIILSLLRSTLFAFCLD